MKTIRLGDPQPHPCPGCGEMAGYQVQDNVRGSYISIFSSEGNAEGGCYTDSMTTTKAGKRAHCSNCLTDLRLKVVRNDLI